MNTKIQRRLEIRESTIPKAGKGLFTKTPFKKGTILGHYTGDKLNRKQFFKLKDTSYVWEIHRDLFIDAKNRPEVLLRFVNGACTPEQKKMINCEAEIYNNKMWYIVNRDIPEKTELIVDYGNIYFID